MLDQKNVVVKNVEVYEQYRADRLVSRLTEDKVAQYRQRYIANLNEKKQEIGNPENPDSKIIDFQIAALEKGWTIEDMPLMEMLAELFYSHDIDLDNTAAAIMENIRNKSITITAVRDEILDDIINLGEACALRGRVDIAEGLGSLTEEAAERDLRRAEYPRDEGLSDFRYEQVAFHDDSEHTPRKMEEDHILRVDLGRRGREHLNRPENEKRDIRTRGVYVVSPNSREELDNWRKNKVQNMLNAEVSNREAVKRVMGEDVYDDIDPIYQAGEADRTVPIHNSRGTKLQNAGYRVLEIDVAGSSFSQTRQEQNGISGLYNAETVALDPNLENVLNAQYGKVASGIIPSNPDLKDIRHKDSTVKDSQGRDVKKDRYTISGPMGKAFPVVAPAGSGNNGDYKIDNIKKYIESIGTQYLTPIFESWRNNKEEPQVIHINLSGHSRGAVAAGEGMKLLYEWLQKKPQSDYKDYVKFNIIQLDPVPGYGNHYIYPENDYSGLQNVESTVVYSMATEYTDSWFMPQRIQGAQRVIIGTTTHGVGLNMVDYSQVDQEGDEKVHRIGYYDAGTKEFYRGSGLTELPEGFYFSDERQNLIRLDSYSQLDELMDTVMGETGTHNEEREGELRNVAKTWFANHAVTTSYDNGIQRENALQEFKRNERYFERQERNGKLDGKLEMNVFKFLKDYRAALERHENENSEETKQGVIKAGEDLAQACRSYMLKTSVPDASSLSDRRKMNRVADLLSLAQKEKNFFVNSYNVRSPLASDKENVARAQLRNARENLEKKNAAAAHLRNAAAECAKLLAKMNEYRADAAFGTSLVFDELRTALARGALVDGKYSIRKATSVFTEIKKAINHYDDYYRMVYDESGDIVLNEGSEDFKKVDELALGANKSLVRSCIIPFEKIARVTREKDIPFLNIIQEQEQKVQDREANVERILLEAERANNIENNNVQDDVNNIQNNNVQNNVNNIQNNNVRDNVNNIQNNNARDDVNNIQNDGNLPNLGLDQGNQDVLNAMADRVDVMEQHNVNNNGYVEINDAIRGMVNGGNADNLENAGMAGNAENAVRQGNAAELVEGANPIGNRNENAAGEAGAQAEAPKADPANEPGGKHWRKLMDLNRVTSLLIKNENGYLGHVNSDQYNEMIGSLMNLKFLTKDYINHGEAIPSADTQKGREIAEAEKQVMAASSTYAWTHLKKKGHWHDAGDTRLDLAVLAYSTASPIDGKRFIQSLNKKWTGMVEKRYTKAMMAYGSDGISKDSGAFKLEDAEARYGLGSGAARARNNVYDVAGQKLAGLNVAQRDIDNMVRLLNYPDAINEYRDMLDTKHHLRAVRWNSSTYNNARDAVSDFIRHRDRIVDRINGRLPQGEKLDEDFRKLVDDYGKCKSCLTEYIQKVLPGETQLTEKSRSAGIARAAGALGLLEEFKPIRDGEEYAHPKADTKTLRNYRDLYAREMDIRTAAERGNRHRAAASALKSEIKKQK